MYNSKNIARALHNLVIQFGIAADMAMQEGDRDAVVALTLAERRALGRARRAETGSVERPHPSIESRSARLASIESRRARLVEAKPAR